MKLGLRTMLPNMVTINDLVSTITSTKEITLQLSDVPDVKLTQEEIDFVNQIIKDTNDTSGEEYECI